MFETAFVQLLPLQLAPLASVLGPVAPDMSPGVPVESHEVARPNTLKTALNAAKLKRCFVVVALTRSTSL